jgi:hypothetical protein
MAIMDRRTLLASLPAVALLPTALSATLRPDQGGTTKSRAAVYELRVYKAHEGRLDDLLKRFREHTDKLFEKHGMKSLAYWTPVDAPAKGSTLIYILAHPSREAATANWKAFQDDPEWQKVRDQSEANGKLVDNVDSTFMELTDFSSVP